MADDVVFFSRRRVQSALSGKAVIDSRGCKVRCGRNELPATAARDENAATVDTVVNKRQYTHAHIVNGDFPHEPTLKAVNFSRPLRNSQNSRI